MTIASRTPEGEFNHCVICGHDLRLEPTRPPGDATCPSCGSLVWFLSPQDGENAEAAAALAVNGELTSEFGTSIPLTRQQLVLGRHHVCDIQVTSRRASGMHCILSFDGGFWVVRDLKSTNGTKVNGQKVSSAVLAPGDKITVGQVKYTIDYTLPIDDATLNV